MEFGGHHRRVSFHWPHQLVAEDGRRRLGHLRRHEPLGAREHELVTDRLVEQYLRLGRVELGTDERHVDEVHAHRAGLVLHRPVLLAAGREIDATNRRVVSVAHGDDRILVLVERGSHGVDRGRVVGTLRLCLRAEQARSCGCESDDERCGECSE